MYHELKGLSGDHYPQICNRFQVFICRSSKMIDDRKSIMEDRQNPRSIGGFVRQVSLRQEVERLIERCACDIRCGKRDQLDTLE